MSMCKDLKPAELQDPILMNGNRALTYRMYARNHKEETVEEMLSN